MRQQAPKNSAGKKVGVYAPPGRTRQATRVAVNRINRAVGSNVVRVAKRPTKAQVRVVPVSTKRLNPGGKGPTVLGYSTGTGVTVAGSSRTKTVRTELDRTHNDAGSRGSGFSVTPGGKKVRTSRRTEARIIEHELGHSFGLSHTPTNRPKKFTKGGGVMDPMLNGSTRFTRAETNFLKQTFGVKRRKRG